MRTANDGAPGIEPWEADLLAMARAGAFPAPAKGVRFAGLDAAFARCDAVTREHSRTFFAATRLLPGEKRRAVRALYAFCRVADDIVDEPGEERLERLLAWDSAGDGTAEAGDPVQRAWRAVRERYGIPGHLPAQLIGALADDLDHRGYEDFPALARYCYGVASTVGLMSMRIIGSRGDPTLYAIRLGVAMQLTNILRDVREDWENGRVYLPRDEMARFGVGEAHLAEGRVDAAWRELMRYQVERARRLYAGARPGIGMLSGDGRLAVSAALELYSRILDRIEAAGYDVFRERASVPGWRRIAILPVAGWRAWRAPSAGGAGA